ncbi:hypothetical protein BDV06DRAFT_220495 [Aspergillus oleicola]
MSSSIPRLYKAGSAANTPHRVSSSTIDQPVSISSGSSGEIPSRIPTVKRRGSSSDDSSFKKCSSHGTIRNPKEKQAIQQYPTDDSKLIKEIKTLEGYKERAISAGERITAHREENSKLRSETSALKSRLNPLENEISILKHNIDQSKLRLAEREKQRDDEQARADGLASQLEINKAQKTHLDKALRVAKVWLKTKQSRLARLAELTDNLREKAEERANFESERTLELGYLTKQLDAEKTARKVESESLQSQLDTITQENADLLREAQQQRTANQNLGSELELLRSAQQERKELIKEKSEAIGQRDEAEAKCAGLLEERHKLEERCRELEERCGKLDGLVESMRRFGATLEDIKQRQEATGNHIASLETCTREEREQARQDHLDVIKEYRSNVGNLRELEENYTNRKKMLEGHISMLQGLCQSNGDSRDRNSAQDVALLNQLATIFANSNQPIRDTLDEFRREFAEVTAAMSHVCVQQLPQADCQELSPPSSPSIVTPSAQVTEKGGQTRVAHMRKKGGPKIQVTCYKRPPLTDARPVSDSGFL